MLGHEQWKVVARIALNPTHEYPFAVRAIQPDGKETQEILCRSRRDCLLVGNGIAHGLSCAGKSCNPNTQFDERLKDVD